MIIREAAVDMLDVSIKSADRELRDAKDKEKFLDKFLNSHCVITAKTDGVKLTILKISDNGDLSDWIFAYKSHILYPGEFDWQPEKEINTTSQGASQFQKVFDHFNKIGKNDIPIGTELQCEFLMRKNTLSSNYTKPHGIILIQHSKSTYNEKEIRFGRLKTKPTNISTAKRVDYAKELGLNAPLVLFEGVLGRKNSFETGIKYPELGELYKKVDLDFSDPMVLYDQLKQLFLSVESQFGGKEEGVVIEMDKGKTLYKWQQSYQTDQEKRKLIKAKTKEGTEDAENAYWDRVKETAIEVCKDIDPEKPLKDALAALSKKMKALNIGFSHSKKSISQIKDDIQLTAKTLLIKRLKGNNGCLVLGKFRVLTNGHMKVIESALKEFDKVCICLVTSADTVKTHDLRYKVLKKAFEGNDRVEIVDTRSGNLIRIMEKASFNINAVYTGTDRVQSYVDQIGKSIGMSVKEIKRTSGDISATKVIERIKDKAFFEANTPYKKVKEALGSGTDVYEEYVKVYG